MNEALLSPAQRVLREAYREGAFADVVSQADATHTGDAVFAFLWQHLAKRREGDAAETTRNALRRVRVLQVEARNVEKALLRELGMDHDNA